MEYCKFFISGKVLSADEIKHMKKEIRPTDKIGQLVLSLLQFDYNTAIQISQSACLCKKYPQKENYIRGIFELETVQYESAKILFNKIPQDHELYDECQFRLSEIYFKQALYNLSSEILAVYDSEKCIERLISCYYMIGNVSGALSLCGRIKDEMISTITRLFLTEQSQELIIYIDSLAEIEGELKYDLLQLKGLCYIKLSMLTEAINLLAELPLLNNRSEITWTLLGIAYFNASMAQEAFWSLLKSAQISPANSSTWLNICFLYSKNNRSQEAELLLTRARKINPNLNIPESISYPVFDFATIGCRKSRFIPNSKRAEKDIKDNIFCQPKPKKCMVKQITKPIEVMQEASPYWPEFNCPDDFIGALALGNLHKECGELKLPKKHPRGGLEVNGKIKKKNRVI